MDKQMQKRKSRRRYNLKSKNIGKLRLSVFRSNARIYAQIIDDAQSITLVSASSLEKDLREKYKDSNIEAAKAVGKLVGKRAIEKKIKNVYFDCSGYMFHGKVKALADAARAEGLNF